MKSYKEMAENVLRRRNEYNTAKKKRTKKLLISITAATLTLIAGTIGVGAAVGSLRLLSDKGESKITSEIRTDVHTEAVAGIEMNIAEFLSDGHCVQMTVHYTATDNNGKKWLAGTQFSADTCSIKPDIKDGNSIEYGVNYGYSCYEYENYRTETDRYFYLGFYASSGEYGTGQAKFTYPMPDGEKTMLMNTQDNVGTKWYRLVSDKQPCDDFNVKYLTLSKLSFAIYGDNINIYEITESDSRMTDDHTPLEDIPIYAVMESGNRIRLKWSSGYTETTAKLENRYTDLVIASGSVIEFVPDSTEEINYIRQYVNTDKIQKIRIGDCCFELEPIEE
ncbi:MAG: hypothetical protein IJZ95_03370 [Oscillospiraceae bacterium]|nr:hypothetical protein [Oscillospiraceae bacterium]